MGCSCDNPTTTTILAPSTTADTQTYHLNVSELRTIDGRNENRRSALVINEGTVDIIVAFGSNQPVDGGGPGVRITPGRSLSVSTTDAVNVRNTSATVQAVVAYVAEVG